ncbi:MAG TPA: polysaccharide ABC transporter ATP-binding protein [Pyrinomonadaceae bacterium]|jgi:lipopolysaccharide transport system ATP-binding protein
MSEIAIRCEGLSKRYRIGQREVRYKALRDTLTDVLAAPVRKVRKAFARGSSAQNSNGQESIWALRDVSFEVERGEVVGIIGHNGAGKSTLLKILSRITKPTEGCVEIHGRVGSLLEVGTGFHPELTGRDNVYLNGSILGMRKSEIERKFDEIVAFAEVEEFVDTPVKRYSTGMYARLAFAVAAHLEPEILVIDEVLAVGDAAFQRKCLGKMNDVASAGRTVLFVSHNMQAIQSLCRNTLLIKSGKVEAFGNTKAVVARYLAGIAEMGSEVGWPEDAAPGNQEIKLTALRVYTENAAEGIYSSSENLNVEMEFTARSRHSGLCIGFDVLNSEGVVVARSYQTDLPPEQWPEIRLGKNKWCCTIPRGLLNAGLYYVSPRIGVHNMYWIINSDPAIRFEVILDHGVSPFWNTLNAASRPGVIAPIFKWVS